jgi:hypothetical protein
VREKPDIKNEEMEMRSAPLLSFHTPNDSRPRVNPEYAFGEVLEVAFPLFRGSRPVVGIGECHHQRTLRK